MSDFKTKHDGEGLGPSEPPATQQSPADRFSTATTLSLTQPTANSAPTDVVAGTHGAPQSSAIGDMVSAKPDGGEGFSSLTLPPSPSSSQPTAVAGGSNNDTSSANLKHLSNGAVAGIAIGALIIGAALAFLAAFLLFKKRSKSQAQNLPSTYHNNYSDSTPELVMMQQKSVGRNSPYVQVSQTPMPAPLPTPVAPIATSVRQPDPVAAFLPALAHESDIQQRLRGLFANIHRHVETYYRDVQASITPSMTSSLSRFGAEGVDMATLLQDCSSPVVAIKHALTVYVLSLTSPRSETNDESIWPENLTSPNQMSTSRDVAQAQSLHKRLAVYIYTQTHSNPLSSRSTTSLSTPTPSSPLRRSNTNLHATIREAAEHFSLTFFPWVNPSLDDEAKEDDVAKIIADALECRVWLFGQEGVYEFSWEGVGTRGVVVSPGVIVDRDGDGEHERVVVEGKVVSV